MRENRKRSFSLVEKCFDECFDRVTGLFPDFGTCDLYEDSAAAQDNGAGSERQYAYCMDGDPMVIAFAPKARTLGMANLRGLMRHEFGHALEYRYGVAELERRLGKLPETVERRADVIAERVWGDPIVYDEHLVQCVGKNGTHPRPRHLPDKKEKLKPNSSATTTRYYHTTAPENVPSIIDDGFDGTWGDAGFGLYLYDDFSEALSYGRRGGWDGSLSSFVVLGVEFGDEVSPEWVEPHHEWDNPEDYQHVFWVEMDEGTHLVPALVRVEFSSEEGSQTVRQNGKHKLRPNNNRAQVIEAGRMWCEAWQEANSDYDGEPTHHETDASLATLATREARKRFGSDDDAVRAFLAGVSLAWTGEVTEPFALPTKLKPNGESLLVGYHGATRRMGKPDSIAESKAFDWGPGLYLSTDPSDSIGYGSHLYQAEVKLTNPVVIDASSSDESGVLAWMKRALRIRDEDLSEYDNKFGGVFALYQTLVQMGEYKPRALSDALQKKGYDGVIVTNEAIRQHQPDMRVHGDYIVVWAPDQLLSWEEVSAADAKAAYDRRWGE